MAERKKIKREGDVVGIVDEARIPTDDGIVTLTREYYGGGIYEVIAASEYGDIETSGKTTRGRSWAIYRERHEQYKNGIISFGEEISTDFEDLGDGLPNDLLGEYGLEN